MGKIT
jgi:hypothetical protein